jgi:flagella basal body P-ring formation protein FlgA
MMPFFQLALLGALAAAPNGQKSMACYPVSHDQLFGHDVAAVVPQLSVIPPDLKLGYSPAPGAKRLFSVAQLRQLAKTYGLDTNITLPICFAWPLRPLSQEEIIAAMKKSLAGQEIDLEITDQFRSLVPEGELNFPLQSFSGASNQPAVWGGFVAYGGSRKFNTWVQVRITVHEKHLIALRPIAAGEVIELAALQTVAYDGPLRRSAAWQDKTDIAGKCARWSIAPGTVLTKDMVVLPKDVEKDELVTVYVNNGSAHIETQGIAGDAGYKGSVIRVRNLRTGQVFHARIDERGVVTVVPGGNAGLVVEDKKS